MNHSFYMLRCINLAHKGLGSVSPNPIVGSVIVKDGIIIGEGYHKKFGGPHAEVHAIESVGNKEDLKDATLYVNLEPCSHFGKTPPCANLIVKYKIPRVVIAIRDPNPEVSGKGVALLRESGIEVVEGISEKESRFLNRRFLTFHEKKRPYIILKWAQSADRFIDKDRTSNECEGPHWISHPNTKKLVHQWRADEDAILVGGNTIRNDNPSLTVRQVAGKNPIRIVLSPSGNIPTSLRIFQDDVPTLIFSSSKAKTTGNVSWIPLSRENNLRKVLEELYARKIGSVFVEGGATTLQSFIDQNIWDEARIIQGQGTVKTGLSAPQLPMGSAQKSNYGVDDILIQFNR